MKKVIFRALIGVGVFLFAVVVGFFWNEARKEIVYLCQNFIPGGMSQTMANLNF